MTNSPKLLKEVKSQIPKLKRELSILNKKVDDKVVNIKLNEVISQLNTFNEFKQITEQNILTLLRYYKLIEECKNAISK